MADDGARRLFYVEGTMLIVTPKGRDVLLPMNFVRRHGFADRFLALCQEYGAERLAGSIVAAGRSTGVRGRSPTTRRRTL